MLPYLCLFYGQPIMIEINFRELLNSVLMGESNALWQWDDFIRKGLFTTEHIEKTLVLVNQISSNTKHPQLQHALFLRATMHRKGQGGRVDYPEAIRLYDMAIALSNPAAMSGRGFMHENGLGGTVNYPEAIRLYKQAIVFGHKHAQNQLDALKKKINAPTTIQAYISSFFYTGNAVTNPDPKMEISSEKHLKKD